MPIFHLLSHEVAVASNCLSHAKGGFWDQVVPGRLLNANSNNPVAASPAKAPAHKR